jgi:hypothetical protein
MFSRVRAAYHAHAPSYYSREKNKYKRNMKENPFYTLPDSRVVPPDEKGAAKSARPADDQINSVIYYNSRKLNEFYHHLDVNDRAPKWWKQRTDDQQNYNDLYINRYNIPKWQEYLQGHYHYALKLVPPYETEKRAAGVFDVAYKRRHDIQDDTHPEIRLSDNSYITREELAEVRRYFHGKTPEEHNKLKDDFIERFHPKSIYERKRKAVAIPT